MTETITHGSARASRRQSQPAEAVLDHFCLGMEATLDDLLRAARGGLEMLRLQADSGQDQAPENMPASIALHAPVVEPEGSAQPAACRRQQSLAQRLRCTRRRAGLTASAMARALGLRVEQYRRFEAGTAAIPADILARVLDLHRQDLARTASRATGRGDSRPSVTADGQSLARLVSLITLFERMGAPQQTQLLAQAQTLSQHPKAREPAAQAPALDPRTRILLVDDDHDALRMNERILTRAGFAVATAADGQAAHAKLLRDATLAALVTDYAMPGLNGMALTELAREQRPDLPVLLLSGYGRDPQLRQLPAGVRVLAKPFSRSDLVLEVEWMLGAPPAARD